MGHYVSSFQIGCQQELGFWSVLWYYWNMRAYYWAGLQAFVVVEGGRLWPTYQIIRKYDIPIKVNKSYTFLTTPRILHTFLKHSNIDNPLHTWQQSKFYRQDAPPPPLPSVEILEEYNSLIIWMRVWILEGLFGVHFLFWKLQLYMHNNQYL